MRSVITHRLTDLVAAQAPDHFRAYQEGNRQRRQHTEDGTQRQVLEDVKAAVVLAQVFSQVKQHVSPLPRRSVP